jgi:4-amino-4-deoxy-L-arabinose transferase-like glycosyltransferase
VSSSAVTAPRKTPPASATPAVTRTRLRPDPAWLVVALITAAAAALRLAHLGAVTVDPFYDAAVRSMGVSWHNFFLGAFEPAGSVSIDKPPVDLWLQVASTKLFGFDSTTLKLPEALAGTASVPLVFAAVRRVFSTRAGLAAATAMAVLPIEVLTSRSDTMDGVMMALIALGLLLVVRAAETGATRWLVLAAATLGLAFNVKLFESMIPLPALALVAYLGLPGSARRRLAQVALAGVVYVVIALSWLTATLLFPAHDRPFAIGSTNGSAWNAAFVFNGSDRIGGKPMQGDQAAYSASARYPDRKSTRLNSSHVP